MRKVLKIVSVILALVIVCEAAVGIYVYQATVHAVNEERRSLACKERMLERRGFDVDRFQKQYGLEEITLTSTFDGHRIPVHYLKAKGAKGTVVMAHGLNGNRMTAYPVGKMFLEHGYNVITYDQRASGENTAEYMTCGLWESYDFRDCVDYVRQRSGEDETIGAWGSSIGGATVGFYLGTAHAQRNLSFAVLDCPVSDMTQIVAGFLTRKQDWIPEALRIEMGSLVTELCLGYTYKEGDVCQAIAETQVPVLIFNTKKDRVTPYHMGVDLYKAISTSHKKLVTVGDSGHTDIYWDHPKMYENTMMEFVKHENCN